MCFINIYPWFFSLIRYPAFLKTSMKLITKEIVCLLYQQVSFYWVDFCFNDFLLAFVQDAVINILWPSFHDSCNKLDSINLVKIRNIGTFCLLLRQILFFPMLVAMYQFSPFPPGESFDWRGKEMARRVFSCQNF